MTKHQVLFIHGKNAFISANNANFPKLAEIPSARILLQDIDPKAPNYSATVSRDALKVQS